MTILLNGVKFRKGALDFRIKTGTKATIKGNDIVIDKSDTDAELLDSDVVAVTPHKGKMKIISAHHKFERLLAHHGADYEYNVSLVSKHALNHVKHFEALTGTEAVSAVAKLQDRWDGSPKQTRGRAQRV